MNPQNVERIEPLWCPREASEYLNISQATLSRWRRQKVGPPFVQLGGVARYNPPSVRAWVREQENRHA
ncbi:helix-turn-helix domain-containing protein [Microbacterium sp. 2MCAF23]|uniref:helix-turn-helix domain-containing protein n=1 Tax=Microbacterium sp. 2MCAF23 TaxID=3232985 RepID=UPI003F97A833